MIKTYRLIDTELGHMTFTQFDNAYELKYRDEVLFYATDTEEGFKFSKAIPKELDYFQIDALRMFLEMIGKCDGMVYEKYEIYQKV